MLTLTGVDWTESILLIEVSPPKSVKTKKQRTILYYSSINVIYVVFVPKSGASLNLSDLMKLCETAEPLSLTS